MPNRNNSKTKEISFMSYIIMTCSYLLAFVFIGAICLDQGYEFTGLVLMLIGIIALAIFNSTTTIRDERPPR
jgi:hypothetical protein